MDLLIICRSPFDIIAGTATLEDLMTKTDLDEEALRLRASQELYKSGKN